MNKNGFTLAETLLAGLIFIIAFASFSFMLRSALGRLAAADDRLVSLGQARAKMEELCRTGAGTPLGEGLILIRLEGPVPLYSLRRKER